MSFARAGTSAADRTARPGDVRELLSRRHSGVPPVRDHPRGGRGPSSRRPASSPIRSARFSRSPGPTAAQSLWASVFSTSDLSRRGRPSAPPLEGDQVTTGAGGEAAVRGQPGHRRTSSQRAASPERPVASVGRPWSRPSSLVQGPCDRLGGQGGLGREPQVVGGADRAAPLRVLGPYDVTHSVGTPASRAEQGRTPTAPASPACSAIARQFSLGGPASGPGTKALARRRGSTRANRPVPCPPGPRTPIAAEQDPRRGPRPPADLRLSTHLTMTDGGRPHRRPTSPSTIEADVGPAVRCQRVAARSTARATEARVRTAAGDAPLRSPTRRWNATAPAK